MKRRVKYFGLVAVIAFVAADPMTGGVGIGVRFNY